MNINPYRHEETWSDRQRRLQEKKTLEQKRKHEATCAKNRSKRKKKK